MNPQKKHKLLLLLLGALVGASITLVLECCCSAPPPLPLPPPECTHAAPPPPAPIATPEDAGCGVDAAPVPIFDAGPSCGTHPWANSRPCCTSDCNT